MVGSTAMILGPSTPASSQVVPNGDPIQINSFTTGSQGGPDVAIAPDGSFVVVWVGDQSSGDDDSDASIQMRRFDSRGAALGDDFQVNQYTTGRQNSPQVAMTPSGEFAVVWRSTSPVPPDDDHSSIQGRWFHADGTPASQELQLTSYTTSLQAHPQVGADSLGNFVVVWTSYGSTGSDTSQTSIAGRRFDSTGAPLGSDLQVNSYTTGRQEFPSLAVTPAGEFVVAWQNGNRLPPGIEVVEIRARRFGADASPAGDEFQVNTYTGYYHTNPTIAAHVDGSFIVAWPSWGSLGSDQTEASLQARWYGSDGEPLADQFQVNSVTAGSQDSPAATFDATGRAVLTWRSTDFDSYDLQMAMTRLVAPGVSEAPDLLVNVDTSAIHSQPSVASDANGDLVVVWGTRWSNFGTDTDEWSVFGRRFDALFRDGFEVGTTLRWSSTSP
jgi:hypothetical protein